MKQVSVMNRFRVGGVVALALLLACVCVGQKNKKPQPASPGGLKGKVRSLGDRVYLPVDEGSIAFLKGSVFSAEGRSVEGARVELARVLADGSAQKIDGRVTNDLGEFSFRLTPVAARYRVTARYGGLLPVSKEIDIEGAAIFRIALSLGQPAP